MSKRLRLPTAPQMEFAHGGRLSSVAFAPNPKYLASADLDRGVCLWDLKLRKKPWRVEMPPVGAVSEEHAALAFTGDGKNLLFVSRVRDLVVLDVSTGKVLRTLGDQGEWFAAAVSTWRTGGKERAVTASAGDLHFWNPSTGMQSRRLKGAGRDVVSLDVADDAKRIALGLASGRVMVRELPSGRLVLEVHQSEFPVWHIAISSCGDLLIGATDEGLVTWHIKPKRRLWSTQEECHNLAISRDGKMLVYGVDSRILLRDVRTGEIVSATLYRSHSISTVAFNNDGSIIATGTDDGRVAVWQLK